MNGFGFGFGPKGTCNRGAGDGGRMVHDVSASGPRGVQIASRGTCGGPPSIRLVIPVHLPVQSARRTCTAREATEEGPGAPDSLPEEAQMDGRPVGGQPLRF